MSWWQWLLVSIGLYITVGMVVTGLDAYFEGVTDSRALNPDVVAYSNEPAPLIALWPLMFIFEWIPNMYRFIYKRGKTRAIRKVERHGRKAQKDAFKELCKQNGWNYRQMRAAQQK